jgi:hypothetical protein
VGVPVRSVSSWNADTGWQSLVIGPRDKVERQMPVIRVRQTFHYGVRQQNATVDIEHAPVTLAVLMDGGWAPG